MIEMCDQWKDEFYKETDAIKRQELLTRYTEGKQNKEELFRERLWVARYGKRRPVKDNFIGSLMQLKGLIDSSTMDIGGRRKREAARIINDLCMANYIEYTKEEQEILVLELANAFQKYIEVSREGRGFTSVLFGMGQLSDESVAKKIAEQISTIAFAAPHALHMDREFKPLQEAALIAFRSTYPNREHFLKK